MPRKEKSEGYSGSTAKESHRHHPGFPCVVEDDCIICFALSATGGVVR